MALQTFDYMQQPFKIQGGPNYTRDINNLESVNYEIYHNQGGADITLGNVQGALIPEIIHLDLANNPNTQYLTIDWARYNYHSLEQDSIKKLTVNGGPKPLNTYFFVKNPYGSISTDLELSDTDGLEFLGMMKSSSMNDIVPNDEDYAYFAYGEFNITNATDGLQFTKLSSTPITGKAWNVIQGIMVVKIPSTGSQFSFTVNSSIGSKTYNFYRESIPEDLNYTIPAGDCETEPTISYDITIPCKIGISGYQTLLPGVTYTNTQEPTDTGVLVHVTINCPANNFVDLQNFSPRAVLNLKLDNNTYVAHIFQRQPELITNISNEQIVQYDNASNGVVSACTNVKSTTLYTKGATDNICTVESDNPLIDITLVVSAVGNARCPCSKENYFAILVDDSFKNTGTTPITGNVKIYYGDILLSTTALTLLPRDLEMQFNPAESTISYKGGTVQTVFTRRIYLVYNTQYSIKCITDNSVTGNVTASSATLDTENNLYTQDCTITIPENLSGAEREWVVTALYKDGDYEATAEYHVHQEALELEWNPSSAYVGAEGGTIEAYLVTNVDNINEVTFVGPVLPTLVNAELGLYEFNVPVNEEEDGVEYVCIAKVINGSDRQEASFHINQAKANYKFNVSPNPLVLPIGNCESKLATGRAEISFTYPSRPQIILRNASYNLNVIEYSNTGIILQADYNPTSIARNIGFVDFVVGDKIVGSLEVQQAKEDFTVTNDSQVQFKAEGGTKSTIITWNSPEITADMFNFTGDSWYSIRPVYKGYNSCGKQELEVQITANPNMLTIGRDGTLNFSIQGTDTSKNMTVKQVPAAKQFYFGCNAQLILPETGVEFSEQGSCVNCTKVYFNTPNESDVAISESYGGLSMNIGPLVQENAGLWSRQLCFKIGINFSKEPRKWNIQATWDDSTINLEIKQNGALYIKCSPSYVVFYRDGGSKFLSLETAISPNDIEIINNSDKVSVTPWSTNTYSVKLGANYYASTSYTLTFRYKKDPSVQCSTRIYQVNKVEGSDYIFCNPSLINKIPDEGGEYTVEVITNLPEGKIGVELSPSNAIPEGWQLVKDSTNYKKAKVIIPPYDGMSIKNVLVRWYAMNTGTVKVTGCGTFLEQGTPTPPYLYFNPSEYKIDYKGGEVVTLLLSGWDTEPTIDFSGLKGLAYTVSKSTYEKDCIENPECQNKFEKIWTITIQVPETDDWQDTIYSIRADGPNNITADFILKQTGVPVTPAIDAEACECNLLNTIGLEALDRYFKHLSQFGYKSYADVDRLLVLGFIADILNSDVQFCISEEDFRVIMNALYCIINKTCLVDYPITQVYDSLIHPILTDPDRVRITEDDILRYCEKGCIRVEEK